VSLALLFVFGYLLGAIGSGVIVTGPIRRVMGFNDARHADPETEGDAVLVLLAVVVGVAALWPVTIPLYYASRFMPAQVD
jgi:hypothetical protein